MKYRKGFVSNSSSSSFVVSLGDITPEQYEKIYNHIEVGRKMNVGDYFDSGDWKITETDTHLKGWTSMDNFNMQDFMEAIGVEKVEFSDGYDWDKN